jgi:hypothetical protein
MLRVANKTIMLSVVVLSIIMLRINMLSIVMLSVVAPAACLSVEPFSH